jgi:hypothetical protein
VKVYLPRWEGDFPLRSAGRRRVALIVRRRAAHAARAEGAEPLEPDEPLECDEADEADESPLWDSRFDVTPMTSMESAVDTGPMTVVPSADGTTPRLAKSDHSSSSRRYISSRPSA